MCVCMPTTSKVVRILGVFGLARLLLQMIWPDVRKVSRKIRISRYF